MNTQFYRLASVVALIVSTINAIAQGNVGISVPDPINTLDIHRGTARTNTHSGGNALYITGGAEFRSADATTGLRIGSNDIFASGANTNVDLSLAGKGSTGSITFKANSLERVRITASGMGIGTTTPNAPLQFASTYENRKIVLVETAFNNHQYYGFGVNGNALRYQTDALASDHVFYAAYDATGSAELMRIKGNGNVGIGTNLPNAPLQFSIAAANRKIVLYEAANNDHQFIGFGQNLTSLRYQVNATTSSHIFYAGATGTTSNELVRITGNGQVKFPSAFANRRIVLYQDVDNDHQYVGFGANAGILRHQVPNTSDSHVFYAGTGTSSSNELMRIKGNGRVGINGVANPNAELHLSNAIANRKIILFEGPANDHEFYGLGVNAGIMRYQVAATGDNHVFYAAANGTSSNELMRIKGNGNVGIGTSTPNAPLQFSNTDTNRKIVLFESANNDHQYSGIGTFVNGATSGNMRYQVSSTDHSHTFYSGETAAISKLLMRIQGNGRVGIGTLNPGTLLDVNGNARVVSHLHVGTGALDPAQELNVVGDAKISGTLTMGYSHTLEFASIPAFASSVYVHCNCPDGHLVVGGGWDGPLLDVVGSFPQNGGRWTVIANNSFPFAVDISVYAICMQIQAD